MRVDRALARASLASAAVAVVAWLGAGRGASEAAAAPPSPPPDRDVLSAARVAAGPEIDGNGGDAAWGQGQALELSIESVGNRQPRQRLRATLRALHDGTTLYLLATWRDRTESREHKAWEWDAATGAYRQGRDMEDLFSVALPIRGEFTGNMLSPVDAIWDVWYWKAARTDPAGYAMDKTHLFDRRDPGQGARRFVGADGSSVFIRRPEDAGTSATREVAQPARHQGDLVARYVAQEPSGSAADVRARGRFAEGTWTVEMARALDTGHEDDARFSAGGSILFSIAAFDASENAAHLVSGVLELRFAP